MKIEQDELQVTSYELPEDSATLQVVRNSSHVTRNGAPGGAVYWLLVLMGLGTFAPCVLLPEWRAYQAVRAVEMTEQQRLDNMASLVQREKNLLEGMQSDPAVIARVARRDLHFFRPGETTFAVDVPLVATTAGTTAATTVDLPPSLARAGAYLPNFNYDALFCDPQTRRILMVLAIGLIGTAIALFWQKSAAMNVE